MIYSLSGIREGIQAHKLKKVLESGENSMFDKKLDREAMKQEIDRLQKISEEKELRDERDKV